MATAAATALLAVSVLSGAALGSGTASDLTTVYSEALAKAVFARHFTTVWKFIDPRYQGAISESRWEKCVSRLAASTASYDIKRISVSGDRRLPSILPLLGKVTVVDVSVQFLYTLPGSRTLNAGVLYAYWVKQNGKWHAVWLPTQYASYKAGQCASSSLY